MKKNITALLYIIVFAMIYPQGYNGEILAKDKRITVDFRNLEILDVIRIISREYDLNIIAGDDVQGKVTVSFRDVAVDEALENILLVNGYSYIKEDNVIRVVSLEVMKEKEEKRIESLKGKREEVYKVYQLKNVKASDVRDKIQVFLGEDDKIAIEEQNNKILFHIEKNEVAFVDQIVRDLDEKTFEEKKVEGMQTEIIKIKYLDPENIEKIITDLNINFELLIKVSKELNSFIVHGKKEEVKTFKDIVRQFDVHPLQVVIEAKIVELTDKSGKDIGINWQYLGDKSKGENYNIEVGNKEVANGTYDGLDMQLGLLSIDNFEMYFSALMDDSKSNLLSNPTITTISGEEARINIGEKFRYRINQTSGDDDDEESEEDIVEIETGIILEVVPVVYEDGKIKMKLMQSVEEVTGYTSDNLPQTSTRETNTNVIVDDGNTLVIGGLIKENIVKGKKYVPILGKIPLLGKIFTSETSTKQKTNLIIFITPKILKTREFSQDIILDENQKIYYNMEREDNVSKKNINDVNLTGRKQLIKMYLESGRKKAAKKEIEILLGQGIEDAELSEYLKKATGGK